MSHCDPSSGTKNLTPPPAETAAQGRSQPSASLRMDLAEEVMGPRPRLLLGAAHIQWLLRVGLKAQLPYPDWEHSWKTIPAIWLPPGSSKPSLGSHHVSASPSAQPCFLLLCQGVDAKRSPVWVTCALIANLHLKSVSRKPAHDNDTMVFYIYIHTHTYTYINHIYISHIYVT